MWYKPSVLSSADGMVGVAQRDHMIMTVIIIVPNDIDVGTIILFSIVFSGNALY